MFRASIAALPLALAALPVFAETPAASAPATETVAARIQADMPGLMAKLRDLHADPELSFQEQRSAKLMAEAARKAGFAVTEQVGKTGVVAVLRNGNGPTVLIRADMDGRLAGGRADRPALRLGPARRFDRGRREQHHGLPATIPT